VSGVSRLHWGCGKCRPPGWINCDRVDGAGIDISCDIRDGLPLDDDTIDYAFSMHALQVLFTRDFVEELLLEAGFSRVDHVRFRETPSAFPEIVDLDERESESLFVEAVK
jgi:predicted SAM-dependent methyltransferase